MTLSDASILFTLVTLILTTVIKTLKESESADALNKMFRGLSLDTQKHAMKITEHDDEIAKLKYAKTLHEEELKKIRHDLRESLDDKE